ncbi:hypothetical protein RB601_009584 [Gaeumannomyces tritici]
MYNATMASLASPEAAAASQKPVKRMRTSKPKTKTGCRNCKQRRIKCDEQRPACTQCVRSRKQCTGYPPPAHSSRPFEEIRIAPKPSPPAEATITPIRKPVCLPPRRPRPPKHPTPPHTPVVAQLPLPMGPTLGLTFDLEEGQYFQLFRTSTASELSGFFDNVFWTSTVLRECHTEEAVKHAVVALGALYKTLEKTVESPPTSPPDDAYAVASPVDAIYGHWRVAIQQYSKAITALVRSTSQDQKSNRTRLMASVLLTCFDSFIGDHKQAIRQIQNGLGLLEKLRAERRRSFMPKPEEPVEDELIQMFTRLAIQAKSYDMAFHFPEPYVIHLVAKPAEGGSPVADTGSPVSTHQEPIPDRFSSLIEARVAWDTLCEQCFRAMETMTQYSNAGPNLLPESMMVYGRAFAARIQSWSDAFDPILSSRKEPGINPQEKAGIAVLKMFQIMGQILYLMTFSDSEMQFDSFKGHFEAIVDLATEVVGDEEQRAAQRRCPNQDVYCRHQHHQLARLGVAGYEYAANHIKPSFSADLGIVPPLYVVAAKSRDPIIRRRAIQLLRSSARREGMWDSELVAQIGIWLVEIEEEDDDYIYYNSPAETFLQDPYSPAASSVAMSGATQSMASPPASSPVGSAEFADVPLGPGGNARWDARRTSSSTTAPDFSVVRMLNSQKKVVPAEKRVLVRSVEFDLREHTAVLKCGTRGLHAGKPDMKFREKRLEWRFGVKEKEEKTVTQTFHGN